MSARQKLNVVAFWQSAIFAALLGWLTNSGIVFVVALIILIGCRLHSGELRLNRRPRWRDRRSGGRLT